jgi:hypothetical protein
VPQGGRGDGSGDVITRREDGLDGLIFLSTIFLALIFLDHRRVSPASETAAVPLPPLGTNLKTST